jgi:hypothetical protein
VFGFSYQGGPPPKARANDLKYLYTTEHVARISLYRHRRRENYDIYNKNKLNYSKIAPQHLLRKLKFEPKNII